MSWFVRRFFGVRKPARRQPIRKARLALEELEARLAPSVNVLQYHNDSSNTGQNLAETVLTPTNVNSSTFGKLFAASVDGQVYAQPLILTGVNITTGSLPGVHTVVFVATEHDSLYAFDASSGQLLWHDALLPSQYGGTVTSVPSTAVGSDDLTPEIGITATPVIDPSTNTIYVEEKTQEVVGSGANAGTHYEHWLQALDVGSGTAKFGGPVRIADSLVTNGTDVYVSGPTVLGTGDTPAGTPRGMVAFDALRQMDRPALTLVNGTIYMGFASHGDNGPYHGWILGYSASTLQPTAVFNTTPNGSEGGIWQGGDAFAVDASGDIYLETGNGTFDTTMNNAGFPVNGDYGDSVIKLAVDSSSSAGNQNGNLNGYGLKVVDYFTPFNQATLNNDDFDLGSGGPFLLPASVGSVAHPNLLVASGKEGRIYLIDQNNMGHFDPNTDHVVQELPPDTISGSFGTGAYFNGQIYYVGGSNIGNPNDFAKTFSISNGQLSFGLTSQSPDTFAYPGDTPSLSANGSSNGIVWAVDKGSNQLRAYLASNLADELYTSSQAADSRDQLGSAIKFAVPTVANGMVYVGTGNALVAYGLIQPVTQPPVAPSKLTATALSGTVVNLIWQDNDLGLNAATGYNILESTNGGSSFSPAGTAGMGSTSFPVGGLQPSTPYTFEVVAFNNVGSTASNTASATTLATSSGLDFSGGFANAGSLLTYNGSARLNGSAAEVTDGRGYEAGSVFSTNTVDVTRFSTQFAFQLSAGANTSDGITFTIQGVGPTALGALGGGLGYSADPANGSGTSIGNSMAVKFDLYNNAGEGVDSTGLYTNGAAPTTPSIDLTNTGIDLHSGDLFRVQMSYDGTTLNVTITDTNTNASANQAYTVNIPGLVGSGAGYVGFTGGTGGLTAVQNVLTWTYTPTSGTGTVPAAPTGLTGTAPAGGTQVNLSWTNNATTQVGFHIDRATSSDFSQNLVTQMAGAGATTFSDTGLTPGTTYYYQVRAFNSIGDSTNSNTFSITTPPAAPQAPAAPSQLAAQAVSATVVNLTWQDNDTAPNLATGYHIMESTNGGTFFTSAGTAGAGATSFQVGGLQPSTPYTFEVVAFNNAGSNPSNTASVTTLSTTSGLDFSAGFANAGSQLTYNGSARLNGSAAEVTDGRGYEAGSVFSTNTVDVTRFTTQFTFQLSAGANASDGITFTIQGVGPTALGALGGGLGYSADPANGSGTSIGNSMAVKFDLYNNAGEGVDSTGLYTNGAAPTTPSIDLTNTGIDLHSGDLFRVQMSYDGTTLNVTITDTNTNASANQAYTVNIPGLVGSGAGYVGFTGGTGSLTAVQNILTWTYTPTGTTTTTPAAPTNLTAAAATGTQVNLTWTNNANNQQGFQIDRSTNSTFSQNVVTLPAAASATTFSDGGLTPGTPYFYRVRAFNTAGPSANSNVVSAITPLAPAAPTNFQATLVTATGVDLAWTNNAVNATSVKLFRQKNTGGFVPVAMLAPNANSFFDTGLLPGTQYTYQIQAANAAGPSALAQVVITTPASNPAGFSAHVNFSTSTGATSVGYVNDVGNAYGSQAGGLIYGWLSNGKPVANTANAVDRNAANAPDELHDSLNQFQKATPPNASWQIAVPNGTYEVHILTGDPSFFNSVYSLNANGVTVVKATPSALNLWADGTQLITVTNGLLTITNGAGASNNKIDAIDVLPAPSGMLVKAIDAGGPAAGSFKADTGFSGGTTVSVKAPIDVGGVSNPAPQAVYQSLRQGTFSYTLPNLVPFATYTVRLDFAELTLNGAGLRTFNVTSNGIKVLSNFDVFQAAGGFQKAVAEQFSAVADRNGKITLTFTGVKNKAIVNGIEVLTATPLAGVERGS